jgi:hypothetical protein
MARACAAAYDGASIAMPRTNRKSAMKVVDGTVKRKNNWIRDAGDYTRRYQDEIVLDRRDPAPGRRHFLTIGHLREYLDLVPDRDRMHDWIDAIILDGDPDPTLLGWYRGGVVALCSWEADLWWNHVTPQYVDEIEEVLDRIGVDYGPGPENTMQVRWTADQIRAFQLTFTLSHELGHHHDMVTNRSWRVVRGEPYAEAFALEMMRAVWPEYVRRFAV